MSGANLAEHPVSLSVISHRQGPWVGQMLTDLQRHCRLDQIQLTANLPDSLPDEGITDAVSVIENAKPRGFGDNHNRAFARSGSPYFCIANPDLRLSIDPFPELLAALQEPGVGAVAPLMVSPGGVPEDNARRFPRPQDLLLKALGFADGRYALKDSLKGQAPFDVDWVAGMFIVFRKEAYAAVGGFDAGFHLYYEDVDLGARLWKAGFKVQLVPSVRLVHDAQRASRRNLRYMRWHATGMGRYFAKHLGRLPRGGA